MFCLFTAFYREERAQPVNSFAPDTDVKFRDGTQLRGSKNQIGMKLKQRRTTQRRRHSFTFASILGFWDQIPLYKFTLPLWEVADLGFTNKDFILMFVSFRKGFAKK